MVGFEWSLLKKGDVVVDVGGGIGSITCILAKKYPELRYVVQDLPATVADGVEVSPRTACHLSGGFIGFAFSTSRRSFLVPSSLEWSLTKVCVLTSHELCACPHEVCWSAAHDFFTPQPVKNAAVFVLRAITHDWSNVYAQKILRLLRDAAQPTTKLVLIDFVIPYAVREQNGLTNIPGAEQPSVPEPLIPDAVSGWMGTAISLQVSAKRFRS
jgi:hypothetical protein